MSTVLVPFYLEEPMSSDKELFLYVFSHVIAIVSVCFIYIGVEQLKRDGYLYQSFPDFPRNSLTTSR